MQNFDPISLLNAFVTVAVAFSTLPGVALLVVAVTNIAKVGLGWFGVSFDGYAAKVAAWLTLGAFGALVYFQVFRPDLSLVFINDQARIAAESLVVLTGLLGALALPEWVHNLTRGKIPFVTASYSDKTVSSPLAAGKESKSEKENTK